MKSDGPFTFYDHALRYANSSSETPNETVTDKAALQALHRYEKDLLKLKERREAEKTQFFDNIAHAQRQHREKQTQVKETYLSHQDFLNSQMEWNAKKRQEDKRLQSQFFKPHYGPEEDEEVVHRI